MSEESRLEAAPARLLAVGDVCYRNRKYTRAWLRDALGESFDIRETLFPWMGH